MFVEGSTIGAYRVVSKLGQGGMGTVYVGEHSLLGRKAAIKVLLPAFSADMHIVQRFFNEAKAVTQIADPGIVQVFDFGHDPSGSAYIVMELLEGETVAERVDRAGRIASHDVVRLMRMVCMSLAAAHAKGIVHRDLKPENIFIVTDPAVAGGERAKVLDFGIAKLSHDPGTHVTSSGAVLGTPLYMSPEQCRGAGEIDHRSDIYSIACVMVMMLTGTPPFEGDGAGELIVAHMQKPPPRLRNVPAVVDHVLQRCLAKQPDDRFQTMTDLAAALGLVDEQLQDNSFVGRASYSQLGRAVTLVEPSTATDTTLSPPARNRGALVGAIAGLAIVIVAIACVVIAASGSETVASPMPESPKAVAVPVDAPALAAVTPPANVADAAIAELVVDAAAPVTHASSKSPPHSTGGSHVRTTATQTTKSASTVDRGD